MAATRRKAARHKVTLLAFRKILPPRMRLGDYPAPGVAVEFSTFAAQIHWIERHLEVIGLRQFCRRFLTGESFARPTVVPLFFNGGMEIYNHVAPVLEDRGLAGVLMLPTDLIGTYRRVLFERIAIAAKAIFSRRENLIAQFPDEQMPPACEFVVKLLISVNRQSAFVKGFCQKVDRIPRTELVESMKWLEWLGEVDEKGDPSLLTWTHVKTLVDAGWELGCQDAERASLMTAVRPTEQMLNDSFARVLEQTGRTPVAASVSYEESDERTLRQAQKAGFLCAMMDVPGRADAAGDLFSLPCVQVNPSTAPDVRSLEVLLSFLK